jgi:hypothetical protein
MPEDEGEISFRVGVLSSGKIAFEFGTAVKWLAMDPKDARHMAQLLIKQADQAEGLIKDDNVDSEAQSADD